ncbi:MAG TPA: hypothetical protein DCY06_00775, partial [Bacteroidetes bacterium]|nr:hypothetical protein [Bacteroidota bacterium]
MKKFFGILILLLNISCWANGQSLTWQKVLGYTDNSGLFKTQQTSDGGYIAIGENRINNFAKMYIAKFNKFGDSLWVKYFDLQVSSSYRGYWIEETHDKGFIIAGSGSGVNGDAFLVKSDSIGNVEWYKTFGGSNLDQGKCVKQIFDKGFILLLRTNSISGTNDIMLVRTDSIGNTIWTKIYGNNEYQEYGNEFQIDNDTGIIIVGLKRITNMPSNLFLIKTNLFGDTLWTKTYSDYTQSAGYSLDIGNNGNYIIGGTADTTDSNFPKSLVMKTDTSGNLIWKKTYSLGMNEWCRSIRKKNNGYVFCGMSDSTLQGYERATVRVIDESGNVVYENFFRPGSDYTNFRSVELTTDNGFILCGVADYGYSLSYIVKTDSTCRIKPLNINFANEQIQYYELLQNYPNPFNSQTIIGYNLPNFEFCRLFVFDIQGKVVAKLVNEYKTKGIHSIAFNPTNYNLSSGIYFYKLLNSDQN